MKTYDSFMALLEAGEAELGLTDWVDVRSEDVAAFGQATRAKEWVHFDTERAVRESPFGVPVAHGYLTFSLCTHFLGQLISISLPSVALNYGCDRLRFPAAVPVGSRVRAHGRLLSATRHSPGVRTCVHVTVECDAASKPACVADVLSLIVPSTQGRQPAAS